MIDVARALPVLRASQSADETAPLKPFAEGDAHVVRSFVDGFVVAYGVEDALTTSWVRWRDLAETDLDRLHETALANLRALARTHLRCVAHGDFADVVVDGKHDAALLLLGELWTGNGAVAAEVAPPIVAAASTDRLAATSASNEAGLSKLRGITRALLVRRGDGWQPLGA